MSLEHSTWTGRKKRVTRRAAHDLRLVLPVLGILGCLAISATVIVAAERLPLAQETSLPKVSAGQAVPSEAKGEAPLPSSQP